LKTGQSAFQRKGDITVQMDTRVVQLKSMIHDATVVEEGRKDRRTELEIKKTYTVSQYNKFMKDNYTAHKYLSYYSVLRKTLK